MLDHLFRREAGRMVAHLTRILGPARLSLAEEAVQEAMLRALRSWPYDGIPENAPAWLFRVARNAALDVVRRERRRATDSEAVFERLSAEPAEPASVDDQLRDDELSMIFMCCHPEIPRDSAVALSLKTVGGFGVGEIARAFLAEETTIAQRLVRAKKLIRDRSLTLELPSGAKLQRRLDGVLDVVYFLFNEGYAVHSGDDLIRHDLCAEALRLGSLLASSRLSEPRVHALVALMALQAARFATRVDDAGDLVLLDDQDRSRWDRNLIAMGFHHFDRSMSGDEVSGYHVQAAIAATHARAASANATEWPVILSLYDQLLAIHPSPVVALNRAVAVSKVHGPEAGLAEVEPLAGVARLKDYHLYLAVRGHLLAELGRTREAAECYRSALELKCSEPERRFLRRQLKGLAPAAESHPPH